MSQCEPAADLHGRQSRQSSAIDKRKQRDIRSNQRFVSRSIAATCCRKAPHLAFTRTNSRHPPYRAGARQPRCCSVRPLQARGNPMSHDDRLELLVEGALHATLLADRQGTILAVNGEAERLFGYARQELIGAPVERLLPEPLRSAHRRLREDYGRTPSPRRMGAGRDLYGLRKDGSRVPIEIGLNPLKEDGDLVILATITDITERKRMDTERDLLIRELSHRVKNSLALAFAIAKHTWRTVETPDAFLDAYAERLQALSRGNDDSLNLTR